MFQYLRFQIAKERGDSEVKVAIVPWIQSSQFLFVKATFIFSVFFSASVG